MTSTMNTVLKQMDYFKEYKYPAIKWNKVYPYANIEDAIVDFSELNNEDLYAYEEGDTYHVSFSDDDYCYSVKIKKQYVV